jgi:hypothetical protein
MDWMDKMLDDFKAKQAEKNERQKKEQQKRQKEADAFEIKVNKCFPNIIVPLLEEAKGKLAQRGFKAEVNQRTLISTDIGAHKETIAEVTLKVDPNPQGFTFALSSISFKPKCHIVKVTIEKTIEDNIQTPTDIDIDYLTQEEAENHLRDFVEKVFSLELEY